MDPVLEIDPDEYKYQLPLPYLAIKCIYSHLNIEDLKYCRLVCRHWNTPIIFDRLVPNISDIYFEFCFTSNSKKSGRNLEHKNLKQLQDLQDIYCGRDAQLGITKLDPKLTLVGVELCPQFGNHLSPEFLQVLQKVTVLELKIARGGKSLLVLDDLSVLLKYLPEIKTLVLPVEYLIQIQQTANLSNSIKDGKKNSPLDYEGYLSSEVGTLQPVLDPISTLFTNSATSAVPDPSPTESLILNGLFSPKICDLTLTLQEGTIPDEKTINQVGLILYGMKNKLTSLRIQWPVGTFAENKKLKSQRESCIKSITQASLINKLVNQVIHPTTQIKTLDLSSFQLPFSIFDEFEIRILLLYLGGIGLKKLGLSLRGPRMHINMGALLPFLVYGERDVEAADRVSDFDIIKLTKLTLTLSITLEYDSRADQVINLFMLSLPCMSRHINSLIFILGKVFFMEQQPALIPYSLRQLLPLRIRTRPDLGFVQYPNITCLQIHTERVGESLFLDFPSVSQACSNLKEFVFIEGNPDLYIPKKGFQSIVTALVRKLRWKGCHVPASQLRVIDSIILRWIFESFPKLERLKLWARMDRVDDNCFMLKWNTSGPEQPQPVRRLLSYVPRLEQISLRGVGKHITDETFNGFYNLQNLCEMEILGEHKLTIKGKKQLMENVKTLRTFNIK